MIRFLQRQKHKWVREQVHKSLGKFSSQKDEADTPVSAPAVDDPKKKKKDKNVDKQGNVISADEAAKRKTQAAADKAKAAAAKGVDTATVSGPAGVVMASDAKQRGPCYAYQTP